MSDFLLAPKLAGNVIGSADGDFVIAEWEDPGGHEGEKFPIAPLHLHREDDEAWYVLSGTLHIQVGEDVVVAGAGTCVVVPKGVPHTYWNQGAGPATYLLTMTPKIWKLIQEIHGMTDRSWDAVKALFERYDSELL